MKEEKYYRCRRPNFFSDYQISNFFLIKLWLFLLLFFPFLEGEIHAQPIKFEQLSVEQGLSQANIWDIHQDKMGFIWIATEDGLNLYDGYSFKVFRNNLEDTNSISYNFTYSIAEDKNGNIWISTLNGLNFYDRRSNKFERFFHDPKDDQSLSSNQTFYIYYDSKENLWVGTPRGLNLYNPSTKKFKRFIHEPGNPNSLPNNNIRFITEDSQNRLWIATRGGICRLDANNKSFTSFAHDPLNSNSLSSNMVTGIFDDRDGNLWVGTQNEGLNVMDLKNEGSFRKYRYDPNDPTSISSNMIQEIDASQDNEIWVGTEFGVNIFNKKSKRFTRIIYSATDEYGLKSNSVSSILCDLNGRIWLGTYAGGVHIYDKDNYIFKHYRQNVNNPYSLSNNNVTSFAEDKEGNLWIGVDGGGVNYYDRAKGVFTSLTHQEGNPNSLSNNKVLSVCLDSKGGLWIGYWAGGLDYYDIKNKKIKHYTHDPLNQNSISGNSIFDIFEDSKGNIWIGTWHAGLNKYNPESDDFIRYSHDPANPSATERSIVINIMEDHQGKIWFGDEQLGLGMLDPKTGEIIFYSSTNEPGDISTQSVYCVYEDSKKRLWVGTNGGGLNLFDRKTGKFTSYHIKDGLPGETIVGILEDNEGNLWLSTFNGLSRFNPDKATFRNYTFVDGLQSNQFNRWSFLKMKSGELLFGGINGFNMFHPTWIKDNTYKPPVYITNFSLFNKEVAVGEDEVLKKNIIFTDEIILDYWQNFFSFEFTALNYQKSENNQYKYILEGLQKDWINAGSERKAFYTNLSPGTYKFKVIASNNDGVWNEEGASIKLIIRPPYWNTLWFKLTAAFVIIGFFFSWTYYKLSEEKKQQRELEEKVQIRTSEVQALNEELAKNEIKLKGTVDDILNLNTQLKLKQEWLTDTQRIARIGSFEYDLAKNSFLLSDEMFNIFDLNNSEAPSAKDFIGRIYKEDKNKVLSAVKSAIENGTSYEMEIRHLMRNGSIRWVLSIGKPFKDETGKVVKLRGVAYDINERKSSEITLRKSEEFFKALIQKSSDYVLTTDNRGNIKYQSPTFSRLTGFSSNERLSRKVTDLIHPEDLTIAEAYLAEILSNPYESITFEVRLVTKEEKVIWIESTLTNLLNHPEVEALVVNTREITERKLAEEQLKKQNEELKKINGELDGFVYRASHDLRAPLSSILGLINITKSEGDETLKQQYFSLMEKSVNKLDLFIKNIIDYSRNSRLKMTIKEVFFNEIIEETFEELKYMNQSELIEKRINIDSSQPFYSDIFRLKIIINNILSNAIRYSNQWSSSYIDIDIKVNDKEAILEFSDNGLGIPEDSLEKIFEMFYRASENNVGSGLGLYIVKEAVVALNGSIYVKSKLGTGTTFTVKIPNIRQG